MTLQKLNTLPRKKMKNLYYIYCRKSTRPEDRQTASLPRQLQETRRLAREKKLNVVGEFVDKGTGWIDRDEDSQFNQMLALINQRNDIAGIICYGSSRVSRNDSDTGRIKKLIINGKIDKLITITETFDINNLEYFGFKQQTDFNYSLIVSKNVRASVKNRVENGIPPYSPKTGYRYSKDKVNGYKQHCPDKTNFFIMRKVFDLYLSGNFSVSELHHKAVDLGLKNTRGDPISRTRLYKNLRDPYYTGNFIYQDKLYAGKHKSLLTDSEHELVLEILGRSSKPRPQKHEFPLNGFIRCGECEMMITGEQHQKTYKNGSSQTFKYYRCTKKGKRCNQLFIREHDLEEQVSGFLSTLRVDDDFFNWSVKWLKEEKKKEEDTRNSALKALQLEHNVVIRRLDKLLDIRLDSNDTYEIGEVDEKRRTLKLQKKNIETNMEKIFQRIDEFDELTVATFDFARTAQDKFENGTFEDKKLVLRAIGSNLILKDKKLTIQPRNPFLLIKAGVEKLKYINKRLEPDEFTIYTENSASLEERLDIWRGRRDSNPQPSA